MRCRKTQLKEQNNNNNPLRIALRMQMQAKRQNNSKNSENSKNSKKEKKNNLYKIKIVKKMPANI